MLIVAIVAVVLVLGASCYGGWRLGRAVEQALQEHGYED